MPGGNEAILTPVSSVSAPPLLDDSAVVPDDIIEVHGIGIKPSI
jgi:hypothetical protein